MQFEDILNEKRITMYRLAKESGIPHTTVRDICGGKAKIKNCTVDTVYRISKVLNISMEVLYEYESEQEKATAVPYRDTFEIFKSNTCHKLKTLGDIDFLYSVISSDEITKLYEYKWFPECLYLLAMVDYISKINDVELCTRYDKLRSLKLEKPIYPLSAVVADMSSNTDLYKQKCFENAIPEFLKYNIVEGDIRNVC